MPQSEELENAIRALEAQRSTLGDEAVDAAQAGLRQKLAALQESERPEAAPAERRTVSILFCDVAGSTALAEKLDPEVWAGIMNEAFELFTEPVDRRGGTVARLMGDAILAFFGAPVAHEEDPQRAVLAGLGILENIRPFRERLRRERGLDFNVRVGINTGLAVVGATGSEIAGEYTAMGDAVNLAARMEQTATPGTVRITEHTYRLVAPLFDCRPLGLIAAKGLGEGVRAYQVLGRKDKPGQVRGLAGHGVRSPLVGRDRQFRQARSVVRRLHAGQGGILAVIGEAGLGKSRLMAELRESISQATAVVPVPGTVTWLEGRTLSYGQAISYWPFQHILSAYAGIDDEADEAVAWSKLQTAVQALFPLKAPEITPYLASLLTLAVPDEYAERVKFLDGEAMGDQILVATRRFFERLAEEQPLVLVFEDLHWADESSVRLLERLLPLVRRVPLLICAVSRPDLETPLPRLQETALRDYEDLYTEITLAPLSRANSTQLVNNLLAIENMPPRVREEMVVKSEGNPFFLEEIIRDMIETGALVRDSDGGRWRATAKMESVTIPDTVQGVILARIDRLDEAGKQVLRAAAVIGRSFLYRVLGCILESDPDLDRHLSELQTAELIREKRHMPELEYIFKHALAREATYESILLENRRQLHAEVGEAVESLFADRLEEFYGLLAYHYARAEAWEQAQEYLLKAGDQSGRVAADAEALANYRQAIAAYEQHFGGAWEPLQRASLARKMGEAYYGLGRLAESREYFQDALALLDAPVPASAIGLGASFLGQMARQALHRLWTSRFIGRADDEKKPALREAVLSLERLGVISYIEGDGVRSIYAFLRSLNLAEPLGFSSDLARAYATNSIAAGLIPPLRFLADRYSRLALESTADEEDLAALAWVLQMTGIFNMGIGRWPEAVEAEERAATINDRIGRLRGREESLGSLASAVHLQGNYARSRVLYRQIYTSGRERGDRQSQVWGIAGRVESGMRQEGRGYEEDALALLEEAEGLLAEYQYPNRPDQIQIASLVAQMRLRKGEWELAHEAANSVAELIAAEVVPSTFYTFEAYAGLPFVYLGLLNAHLEARYPGGQEDSLRKQARQACRSLSGFARIFPVARPRARLWQGVYEWVAGKERKAQQLWQMSLADAVDLKMPYDRGLAHYQIGRHLPPDDSARRQHLEQAVEIFAQLDAVWDLAQVRRAG